MEGTYIVGGTGTIDALGIGMYGLMACLELNSTEAFSGNPRGGIATAVDAEGGGVGRGGVER